MAKIHIEDLIIKKFDAVLYDILDGKHTHYTLKGGRGCTKSSFVALAIILLLTRPENKNLHAVVFRKVANTLRDSVYAQICWAITALELDKYFKTTVSPMKITYIPTGQTILFRGLDEKDKMKSIKAPFGHFGVTWFEELDQYHGRDEIRSVLQSTMRGEDGRFWNFETFNPPISSSNWANKDARIKRPDRLVVEANYLDVPKKWLSQTFFDEAEILKQQNEKAYRHEYLGEVVGTGGNVFENVIIQEIKNEQIKTFDRNYYGLDFGWYPDPNAFVETHFCASERILYIYGEIRRNKTSNAAMAELLEPWRDERITADNMSGQNEDKNIADFRTYGFDMRGAIKGPGSVDYSTKWLQSLKAIIIDDARCPHAAEEFLTYEYERDKNGDVITGYPDANNHFIDAVRYALENVWRRRGR